MSKVPEVLVQSPTNIAATYAVMGVIWITATDQLVYFLADSPTKVTQLQTAKGWVFVGFSTAVVYGLVSYGQRELRETNSVLDKAVQQTSILHRILSHNLRNACNIIQGHAELIADDIPEKHEESLAAIYEQNRKLTELSRKSERLRDVALKESELVADIDLVEQIRSQIATVEAAHPAAEINADLPETLRIETDPRIGIAIRETLTNAIEHNDKPYPTVHVSAQMDRNGTVTVDVADEGPGLPRIEREVLSEGLESPLLHSDGLGLWLVRTIVVNAGGELQLLENKPHGTVVRAILPGSSTTE